MNPKNFFCFFLWCTVFLTGCKKDKVEQTAVCNSSLPPIVMAHGFLASGDTYANQFMRFSSNGYCEDRLFAFDWNSLDSTIDSESLLDAFIDEVRQKTGSSQVILAGHSAGGGLGYNYLSDPVRAAKVAKYIHLGSFANSGPAGPGGSVPTLNIYSPNDEVVNGADIPGAVNVSIPGKDHYEVATCKETFAAIFSFIQDGATPTTTEIVPDNQILIKGRALTLGENAPAAGANIKIYETNPTTGLRKNTSPDHTITADANGYWGPVKVNAGATYEFEVKTTSSTDRVVHYYREPFIRSNPLVYLRTLPPPGGLAGLLVSSLPSNDAQSAAIVFSSNQAVIAGRDELLVENRALSSSTFSAASATSIAYFLYDGNNNQQTDFVSQGFFGSFPFLEAIDMFFPTTSDDPIECSFNGRNLRAKSWKSASEGVVIFVLD